MWTNFRQNRYEETMDKFYVTMSMHDYYYICNVSVFIIQHDHKVIYVELVGGGPQSSTTTTFIFYEYGIQVLALESKETAIVFDKTIVATTFVVGSNVNIIKKQCIRQLTYPMIPIHTIQTHYNQTSDQLNQRVLLSIQSNKTEMIRRESTKVRQHYPHQKPQRLNTRGSRFIDMC